MQQTPTFEEAYTLYAKRVRSLCFRMVKNDAEAEDLAQEVFLHLFRKIHLFRGDSQFYTWLHRLTVNVVLMKLRRNKGHIVSLEGMKFEEDEVGNREYSKAIMVRDALVETAPDRIAIDRAINDLPPGYRTILVLHDIEGLEHHEIAEIVGCSIGNSKSRLNKARAKIATVLRGNEKSRAERTLDSTFSDIAKFLE